MLVLMAIEDMLADFGCTSITVAGNIEKALALVNSEPFDLATLDVNLDGQRSYAVARALNLHGVPFAFSTGYGEHGVGDGFGNRPVLNKPFNQTQLFEILKGLLADPKGHPSSTLKAA